MMELWDEYRVDRTKTGGTLVRGEPHGPDSYHLVVHACLFNTAGELLIQQRQSSKQGWPDLWDLSAGGSALCGESSQQAMERELREELGLALDLRGARPNLTVNFADGFDDIYLLRADVDLAALTFQPEEVQAARWAGREEVLDLVRRGQFVPYYESFLSLLFDSLGRYGAVR